MLSDKVYTMVAEGFGVTVGVAHTIYKGFRELETKEEIRKYNEDRYIDTCILKAIERGKYQRLQREIYRIRKEIGKRKLKESTIYKKAWYSIVNGNNKTNISKSSKVLQEAG